MTTRHSPLGLSLDSAETIARRLPFIWWQFWQPTVSGRAEMAKMVIEKQMAFVETCFAMQVEAFKLMAAPGWAATPAGQAKAAEDMVQAAIAPYARRAKANALRLRRR